MHPVLLSFGDYPVHTYAVCIALGFVVCVWLSARHGQRVGMDREMILDLCWWLLVMGLVGSRLAFIATNWDQYWYPCVDVDHFNRLYPEQALSEPDCLLILKFWKGGLVFYGAPIASLITLFVFMRREKLPALPVADLIIIYLPLGQFFGRLGCLGAGCCFGKAHDGPLSIVFPRGSMAWEQHVNEHLIERAADSSLPVYATQLFDAFSGLALFGVLFWLHARKRWNGQVMVAWLVLYPLIRSINELYRGDEDRKFLARVVVEPLNALLGLDPGSVTFLSTSQFISVLVATVGLVLLYRLRSRPIVTP
ncbi:MAG: prolipoprotein diacylglyceryl transferase [Bradymonadia bacterium]